MGYVLQFEETAHERAYIIIIIIIIIIDYRIYVISPTPWG